MTAAVIVSAVRTAIATARRGSLVNTSAEVLALAVLRAVVDRSGLSPHQIDDVIFAESLYGGGAVARHAAIEAGLTRSGGVALNRHCAGSLTAVGLAAASVLCGMERVVVAGGVQSSSTAPTLRYRNPDNDEIEDLWAPPTHPDSAEAPNRDMVMTIGWNTAQALGITRQEMDAWALRSHHRANAAIDDGRFIEEIIPVSVRKPDGTWSDFKVDEHPRRDSSIEKLSALRPLRPEIDGFSITAGNSSGINDAAAALTVTTDCFAREEHLTPLATIRSWAAVGVEPRLTGLAVLDVISKVLQRAAVRQSDVTLWEINEAFASVPIAACKQLGIDDETVNISGSGCSLGHPIAASGGRMITTLIGDLRRRGGGVGVAAMCAGGGQAGAVLIEV